jgi:hypothetical protein
MLGRVALAVGTTLAVTAFARRKLILHIGAPKAGSSAIQFALYQNRNKLRELGILIPTLGKKFKEGVVPGKRIAKHLARWLSTERCKSNQTLLQFVECCSSSNATRIVLSSEKMWKLSWEQMAPLQEAFDTAGVDVQFVYYVRSIADQLLSHQSQVLRRNKPRSRSLAEISQFGGPRFKATIQKLLQHTEPSNLNVRSYDNACEDLARDFLINGVALSEEETSQLDLDLPRANPSLLGRELRLMEVVNKLLVGAKQSEYVTNLLISAPSRKPPLRTITSQQAESLERFREEVAFVNKYVRNGSIDLWSNKVQVCDEADELSATELMLAEALALSVQARPPHRERGSWYWRRPLAWTVGA